METVTEIPVKAKQERGKKDGIRIAIVEDDPMYRHAIEYYLDKIPGSRLFSFESGEECFRYYHMLDPEIMILDYRLNDLFVSDKMTGLDILREVKSVKPETEIIFLSGQEDMTIATSAIKEGATEYIVKDLNALTRLQKEVTRLSLFIRLKRDEVKNAQLLIGLSVVVVLLVLLISFSGYFLLATAIKILFGSVLVGLIAFYFLRKKIKHAIPDFPFENEKPGVWHD